jgi:hypothetical protein
VRLSLDTWHFLSVEAHIMLSNTSMLLLLLCMLQVGPSSHLVGVKMAGCGRHCLAKSWALSFHTIPAHIYMMHHACNTSTLLCLCCRAALLPFQLGRGWPPVVGAVRLSLDTWHSSSIKHTM